MHGIMMRLSLVAAVLGVLIFSAPLMAQDNYGIYAPGFYVPGYYGPAIETPEGSRTCRAEMMSVSGVRFGCP